MIPDKEERHEQQPHRDGDGNDVPRQPSAAFDRRDARRRQAVHRSAGPEGRKSLQTAFPWHVRRRRLPYLARLPALKRRLCDLSFVRRRIERNPIRRERSGLLRLR